MVRMNADKTWGCPGPALDSPCIIIIYSHLEHYLEPQRLGLRSHFAVRVYTCLREHPRAHLCSLLFATGGTDLWYSLSCFAGRLPIKNSPDAMPGPLED